MNDIIKDLYGEYTLTDDSNLELLFIPNTRNPKLILFSKNYQTYTAALEIFNPAGIKGKILKSFLKNNYILSRKIFERKFIEKKSDKGIIDSIKNFTGKEYTYSVLVGTKGLYQKNTIQLMETDNIIGYVKYSKDESIIQVLQNETRILKILESNKFKHANIPKVLFDLRDNNLYLMLQSAEPTLKKTKNKLTKIHIDFLIELANLRLNEENVYFNLKQYLIGRKLNLITNNQSIIKAIKMLQQFYDSNKIPMVLTHGDFAPWNISYSQELIYVYDWEYGKENLPPGVDGIHFIFQTLTLIYKINSPRNIIEKILNNKLLNTYFENLSIMSADVKYFILFYFIHILLFNTEKKFKEVEKRIFCEEDDKIIHLIQDCIDYIILNF